MTWEAHTQSKIDAVIEQIMAWGAAMTHDARLPPQPAQALLLRDLYEQALPLSRLMDRAHLAVHAEGPGAAHDGPRLAALNWLAGTCERVLKALSVNWLDGRGADGRRLVRHLDLRLCGMAPGSLWMGFRIEPMGSDLLARDQALIDAMAQRIAMLPEAARFIDDEALRPGIVEALPDPAERDILLDSLLKLAPTGRAGIHTLGLSAPSQGQVTLGGRERVVLRDALRRPIERDLKAGAFIGEVRAADLDKTRLTLRTADGPLRCVLPEMSREQARALIGEVATVRGRYASDREGRARLLYVEQIEPAPRQQTLNA